MLNRPLKYKIWSTAVLINVTQVHRSGPGLVVTCDFYARVPGQWRLSQ